MTSYDRISIVVGVVLVGVVLLVVMEIPIRVFQFRPLGTPLALRITGTWIVSALLVGLSCAGTEALMRTHPSVRRHIVRFTFPSWILPGLTTLALAVYLPRSPNLLYWLIGLVAGGSVMAWLILINYRMLDVSERLPPGTRMALRLVVYLMALLFFTVIYHTRLRSLISATMISLVAFLIALSTLSCEATSLRRTTLYSGVIGIVLGEATWALNYWRANSLTVGVLLMLFLYVLTGIAREHVRGAASRRVVIEFLAAAAVGVWIILRFGPK